MVRRLAVFGLAVQVTLLACSGGSDAPGAEPQPTAPPPTDPGPPVFIEGGVAPDAVANATPPECPSRRTDPPADDFDETTFRARVPGVYRVCGLPGMGLEVRIDSDTDALVWYELDSRFVRTNDSSGRIEITSCSGSTCSVDWIVRRSGGPEESYPRTLSLWNAPVAVAANDGMFPDAWVRVAD